MITGHECIESIVVCSGSCGPAVGLNGWIQQGAASGPADCLDLHRQTSQSSHVIIDTR